VSEPLSADSLVVRWNELASDDTRAAYRASWALSAAAVVPFLRDHLQPAVKLTTVPTGFGFSPEALRAVRAIAALERAGTPEARGASVRLPQGAPAAVESREANAALDRLK